MAVVVAAPRRAALPATVVLASTRRRVPTRDVATARVTGGSSAAGLVKSVTGAGSKIFYLNLHQAGHLSRPIAGASGCMWSARERPP
jgi:hypothetical protein